MAAARTERVELVTTVLDVGWRNNPVLLAKQLASVEQISGGRLTAGLGLGGWPEDYAASQAPQTGLGVLRLRTELEALRAAGATDVVLYPASAALEQIDLLAGALSETGVFRSA